MGAVSDLWLISSVEIYLAKLYDLTGAVERRASFSPAGSWCMNEGVSGPRNRKVW